MRLGGSCRRAAHWMSALWLAGCAGSSSGLPAGPLPDARDAALQRAAQSTLSIAAGLVFTNYAGAAFAGQTAGCRQGIEYQGNTTLVFYDANCTRLWRKSVWTAGAPAYAQSTWYASSGAIQGYASLEWDGLSHCSDCGYGTLTANVSLKPSGNVTFALQNFCHTVLGSGSCNETMEANAPPLAQSIGVSASYPVGAPSEPVLATALTGALNAFTPLDTGSTWGQQWTIQGSATATSALSGNVQFPFGPGSTNVVLNDSPNGLRVSASVNADSTVSGTIEAAGGGSPVASFSVDANGFGSVRYSDGRFDAVTLYAIQ